MRLLSEGYYNEARILEPVNFNTVLQLPNIPGSVNNCEYLVCTSVHNENFLTYICDSPRRTYISAAR
jgi:hypothetical protein